MAMRRWSMVFAGGIAAFFALPASAQEASPVPSAQSMTAPALVRKGNRLLLHNRAGDALDAYGEAEQLQPDAREIAFVQGLGHYELGQFEEALGQFESVLVAEHMPTPSPMTRSTAWALAITPRPSPAPTIPSSP